MNGEMGCEQVRELAPDLAVGIADGQERDHALRHVATCPDCRRFVSELSSVVDDLLLLAPSYEPPVDFASRTVARLSPPPARRRRPVIRSALRPAPTRRTWRTRLAVAASFVVALSVGAGAVLMATAADRRLADDYRGVLAQGHGSFFAAAPIRGPGGVAGTVFGYQGQPSWLFATVHLPASDPTRFEVRLVDRTGASVSLGSAVLGGTDTTWGTGIPVDLTEVSQLRFEGPGGQGPLIANFDVDDPWGPG